MSDEEKKAIEQQYNSILNNAKANWIYEDYEILLNFQDLYKHQQKEIEEYKLLDANIEQANKIIRENKKWEDKIKAKIEELGQIKNTALTYRTVEMMHDKINILQSLLEKE